MQEMPYEIGSERIAEAHSESFDISNEWNSPCAAPFNPDGTVNPTCNAFLAYNRSAPTRTLFPTEQFRFQSASIPHFTMNGRFIYSGTTSDLTNFYELFNGLESRTALRHLKPNPAVRPTLGIGLAISFP